MVTLIICLVVGLALYIVAMTFWIEKDKDNKEAAKKRQATPMISWEEVKQREKEKEKKKIDVTEEASKITTILSDRNAKKEHKSQEATTQENVSQTTTTTNDLAKEEEKRRKDQIIFERKRAIHLEKINSQLIASMQIMLQIQMNTKRLEEEKGKEVKPPVQDDGAYLSGMNFGDMSFADLVTQSEKEVSDYKL